MYPGAVSGAVWACDTCPHHTARHPRPDQYAGVAVGRRHLAYHLLPIAGRWEGHAARLRAAWPLFTGRKVIAVATGGAVAERSTGRPLPLDPPEAVRAALPPDAEFVTAPNDPGRWELASWAALWGRILDGAAGEDAVLYAHGMGVTRPPGSTAHAWTDLLYRLVLGDWPSVEAALRRHPVAGPLKKVGHFFTRQNGVHTAGMDRSSWHYSGNFWWTRAGTLRDRLRRVTPPPDRWAAEAWIGIAFAATEAGDLWTPPGGGFDLYQPADLARVSAAFAARPAGSWPRLSVVIPTTGRPSLAATLASLTPQLHPGDEVIVQRDDTRDWGATPRTRGMTAATGDYLLFMDDDDTYEPGAFDVIRAAIREHPGRPLLFGMRRGGTRERHAATRPGGAGGERLHPDVRGPERPGPAGRLGAAVRG